MKKTNKPKKGSKPPQQAQASNQQITTVQQALYTGPIPQPNHLEHYDKICPGAADRIISMAEKEQSHQHSVEKDAIAGEISERRLGQLLAFGIAFATIGVGAYTGINGAEITGSFIGVGGVTGLAWIFIKGRDR